MATKSLFRDISEVLRTCLAGSAFGGALTIAQVYLPAVIINQMRMRDFHMLEVFLTATSLSAIVFVVRQQLSNAKPITRANSKLSFLSSNISPYDGNILGGSLIGAGMAMSGACPGTVIIQLAQGIPSSRLTFLGAVVGGTAWSLLGDRIVDSHDVVTPSKVVSDTNSQPKSTTEASKPHERNESRNSTSDSLVQSNTSKQTAPLDTSHVGRMNQVKRLTISQALSANPTKTFLTFLFSTSTVVVLSKLYLPGKTHVETSTITSGALIAIAQATSLLLINTPLGTSKAYEEMGQIISYPLRMVTENLLANKKDTKRPQSAATSTSVPATSKVKNIIFALGMALGSLAINYLRIGSSSSISAISSSYSARLTTSHTQISIPLYQSLLGGFILSFGARMAGGCTSGHGISGLSSLSFASLISVLSMFGAGIGVRLAMDLFGM